MANYNSPKIFKNLINKTFGRLKVISRYNKKALSGSYAVWRCICECGKYINVTSNHLLTGNTKSCGCLQIEKVKEIGYKNRNKYGETPLNILYRNYKNNAKTRNFSFNLTQTEFNQLVLENCYYCGSKPYRIVKNYKRSSDTILCNGIDRVDNKLGYIVGNCVTCCQICNMAKGKLSIDIFEKWLLQVCKYRGTNHEFIACSNL